MLADGVFLDGFGVPVADGQRFSDGDMATDCGVARWTSDTVATIGRVGHHHHAGDGVAMASADVGKRDVPLAATFAHQRQNLAGTQRGDVEAVEIIHGSGR